MLSASEESDDYGDLLFDMQSALRSKSLSRTKCYRCNKEVECLGCEVELCKFVICKTCYKLSYDVLESHSYGQWDKDDYDKWLGVLGHVSTCGNQLCEILSCKRARELMTHLNDSKNRLQGFCTKCIKIWEGVRAHASHCTNLDCCISLCRHVKEFKSFKGSVVS